MLVVVVDNDDVVVKMLAAPIHPADINIIQGILTVNVLFYSNYQPSQKDCVQFFNFT